jgi:hypothetical protein
VRPKYVLDLLRKTRIKMLALKDCQQHHRNQGFPFEVSRIHKSPALLRSFYPISLSIGEM